MHASDSQVPYFPFRATFAKLICAAVMGLIFAGGVVTSKNAGLSVPDWPTSFGYHMWGMPFAMWKGGVLYEHFHRVFASLAGLLVLLMAVWLMIEEKRRRLRVIGLSCLALVILQGILGGLTVLHALPVPISVAHGVLAQLFFCLTIVLAYGLSRERADRVRLAEPALDAGVRRGALAVVALVALQLVIAAWMRHDFKFQGGVAIPDFPRTAGRWVPAVDAASVAWVNTWRADAVRAHGTNFDLSRPVQRHQMVLHLTHRALAAALILAFAWLTATGRRCLPRGHRARRTLVALDGLLVVQISLGILTVWSSKGPLITSLHVMTGAATLGTAVLLALRVLPASWAETPVPAAAPASPAMPAWSGVQA
ncbi:MAG: COX15/CtaA family protein [Lentisphaerae bacterium]|nr:COX15/CtaA family protein [Lentisphaerota bacterium]